MKLPLAIRSVLATLILCLLAPGLFAQQKMEAQYAQKSKNDKF